MKYFALVLIALASFACDAGMSNVAGPIDSATRGRNGYVSVVVNNQLWFPDSVSTNNYHAVDPGETVSRSHVRIYAWSDGYTIAINFTLPDTLPFKMKQSFVLCRNASIDFTTPYPARNAWTHDGDSVGTLSAMRVDDSTVSGKFNLTLTSAYATYWLSNGNFYARLAQK